MAWLGTPPKWSSINPVHILVCVVLLLVALCIAFGLWLRNRKDESIASSSSTNILGNETNNMPNTNNTNNTNDTNNTNNKDVLLENNFGRASNAKETSLPESNALVSPSRDQEMFARRRVKHGVSNTVDLKVQSQASNRQIVPVEVKIEEPKEVVCELKFVTSLVFPCVVRELNIKNCISAEVVRAVIPRTDYTVKSVWLDVKAASQPTFVRTTIPDGIYDILELLAALTHAVSTSGYSSDAVSTSLLYLERTSKVVIANQALEDFVMNMSDRLAYMLGMEASYVASSNAQVTGTRRVDLSGARSVFITTTQFSEHKENILQEVPLDAKESVWENNHLEETERIFPPRNVLALNLNVMVKYPNFAPVLEAFDANGVALDITIRFKCLRYAASNFVDTELEVC